MIVAGIVLTGVRMLSDTGTQFLAPRVVLGFAMAAALGAGVGTLNCYLTNQFTVYASLWRVATRPLMLVSGVLFLIERLPAEWQPLFLWNPLVHVIAEVRAGFYHGYDPAFLSPALVFMVALVSGTVGVLFLWRYYRDVLED
jgi:capsular polysaccharide transport system permease protein